MTQQNRETLLALADICEKAAEPSFDLFAEAFEAIHGERAPLALEWSRLCSLIEAEAWLDAAMTLADKPDEVIRDAVSAMGKRYALHMRFYDPAVDGPYSQALARMVCAAALRATASSLEVVK